MAKDPLRIDVHSHILPEFYIEAITAAGITRSKSVPYPLWSLEGALKLMDNYGIGTSITSISTPAVNFGDNAKSRQLARKCNDFAAGLIQKHPDRFGSFATLPLPDVDSACREAIYVLDEMNLDGIVVLASYGEIFQGDPMFDPLYEELNRRSATVFVHPTQHPSSKSLRLDLPLFAAEYTFDTTRAAINLMTKGTIKRFPNIRFVLAHAGGVLPFLAWRLGVGTLLDPALKGVLPDDVPGALKHFWYDTALAAGRQCLGTLMEVADPKKIVFGTDWPYAGEKIVDLTVKGLTEPGALQKQQRTAIDRSNALALFPRLAKYS